MAGDDFKGFVVVVTGASTGLGRAIRLDWSPKPRRPAQCWGGLRPTNWTRSLKVHGRGTRRIPMDMTHQAGPRQKQPIEMKRILHVVGARPNYMKIAPLYAELERRGRVEQKLVHTGQHYDRELSEIFFEELEVPPPEHRLEYALKPARRGRFAGSSPRRCGCPRCAPDPSPEWR